MISPYFHFGEFMEAVEEAIAALGGAWVARHWISVEHTVAMSKNPVDYTIPEGYISNGNISRLS